MRASRDFGGNLIMDLYGWSVKQLKSVGVGFFSVVPTEAVFAAADNGTGEEVAFRIVS